ncbi:MAG: endolytic transglycosylase MltG [Leptospirales bacterium]|nr:endolytic transglycosylase MltG [Leptospirales bacterium]
MGSARMKKMLILALAVGGALLLGGFALVQWRGAAAGDGTHRVEFEVAAGAGALSVSRALKDQGLVRDADWFRTYLRLRGLSGKLKTGVYELNDGMSVGQIAAILSEGRVRLIALTIPEGWNNRQIGDYLAEKGFVRDRAEFLRIASDPDTLRRYGISDASTEGYLFPETYMAPPGYPAAKLQELMLKRYQQVLKEVVGDRQYSPVELRERVILASIVEREAVRPEERPMMSQVFLNRLHKRMRLESCATIQYLLDRPRAKLYDKDLQIVSPYNTYRNAGLPPGPISNPGRAAIEAAFAPAQSEFLYFVLKPDGSHHFSATYSEHLEAKRRYLGG